MKIRYRDKSGKIVSRAKAEKTRGATSELLEGRKQVGKRVKGVFTSSKKLAREAMPTIKTTKHRTKARPVESESGGYDDYDIDDYSEDEWEELADDFPEIDLYMDGLEDLLEDDDEWYEEA